MGARFTHPEIVDDDGEPQVPLALPPLPLAPRAAYPSSLPDQFAVLDHDICDASFVAGDDLPKNDPFQCPICWTTCVHPVTASCGAHTFCRHCLAHVLSTAGDAAACPMCRKPLLRGELAINQGIANAIRQRAATARLLEAVNHGGFRPIAANWAAKTATAAVASSDCAESTARALARIPTEALFQAGISKAFSLGAPYDLVGASQLYAVAAARGHASAAAHLAYLQSHGCVRAPNVAAASPSAHAGRSSGRSTGLPLSGTCPAAVAATATTGTSLPDPATPQRRAGAQATTPGGSSASMSGWKDSSEFVPLFVAAADGGDPFAQARCVQMGWGGRPRDLQGAVRLFEAIVAAAASAGAGGHPASTVDHPAAAAAAALTLRPPASVAALAPQVSGHRLVPGSSGHVSEVSDPASQPRPGTSSSATQAAERAPASSEEGLLHGTGATPPPAVRPPQAVSSGSKRRYSSASGSTASGADGSVGSAAAVVVAIAGGGKVASRSPLASFSAPLAMTQLALCSRDGYGEPTSPAKAAKWAQAGAVFGDVVSLTLLGCALQAGDGVMPDEVRGAVILQTAATAGYAVAQTNWGASLHNGRGTLVNAPEAVVWYKRAAAQGTAVAPFNLGVCFRDGAGVRQDGAAATACFQIAADRGYARAQYELGRFHEFGLGSLPKDPQTALVWYLKAADQSDPLAQFALGCLFEAGAGEAVPKSIATALEWYAKAAAVSADGGAVGGAAVTGMPASGDAADTAVARAGRMALARLRAARDLPAAQGPAAAAAAVAAAAALAAQAAAAAATAAAAAGTFSEDDEEAGDDAQPAAGGVPQA